MSTNRAVPAIGRHRSLMIPPAVLITVTFVAGWFAVLNNPSAANGQDKPSAALTPEQIEDTVRAYRASLYFKKELLRRLPEQKKVIYGKDHRKDVALLDPNADKTAATVARSTCVLTSKSRLTQMPGGKYRMQLSDYVELEVRPCSTERFKDQKVGGWCSGFLVAPDLIATAGHCCEPTDTDAQSTAFVFGFFATKDENADNDADVTPGEFAANQVYFGKKVAAHKLSETEGDFAIIQLDRPVTAEGAIPLKVRRSGEPTSKQPVGMVGYPSGLPGKAVYGERDESKPPQIWEVMPVWLRTNLDSYAGNSGSVVTDAAGVVEGILVSGLNDFEQHSGAAGKCFRSIRLDDEKAGEIVTRASMFADHIPHVP